jgi:tRNA/tmRNA/rRNA uracil-C5-methylase (TrmA/RlmC/RlmD family)
MAPDAPELLEVETGAPAAGGGCVARAPDGRVVFVRHALPGERVLARVTATTASYLRADAVDVLEASPDRVPPPCPHAGPGRCGGCDYQHVALDAQRRLKATLVSEQLRRVAGVDRAVDVEAVPGGAGGLGWRTWVRAAVDRHGSVGFRRHRSHRLEHVDHCPVATPALNDTGALGAVWPGAAEIEVMTANAHDEALVIVSPHGRSTPRLPELDAPIGLVVRDSVRRPPGAVPMVAHGRSYRVSAGVFWQAHLGAAEALLDAVLDAVGPRPGESIADLYAGAGLFAVALAEQVGPSGQVVGVERDGRACVDARHNGAALSQLDIVQAGVTPDLVATGLGHPDVFVLDPTRHGAGIEVMSALARHAATCRRIVYVSCDPASFARDARVLLDEGWRLETVRAFDIFPMTEHVELVATLAP